MPDKLCENCFSYKVFGKKCWFYWEDKKTCSQHRESEFAEPAHKSLHEQVVWM